MEWYWILTIVAILFFCLWVIYRIGFIKGYKAGARQVLKDWRQSLDTDYEEINPGNISDFMDKYEGGRVHE